MLPDVARVHRFDTIAGIGREGWNACFPGELEDYDYFVAIERSHIEGFAHHYYALMEGEHVLACVPAFFTEYDLATTAQGAVRRVLTAFKRVAPFLMTLKLVCLGSPETESCTIGMHPDLSARQRSNAFAALMDFFAADAYARGAHVLGIKDISADHRALYGPLLAERKFHFIASLPVALLAVDFPTIEVYMSRLSAATRKNMRRKLKKQSDVRVEHRCDIEDVLDEVIAMYRETKDRSDWQFEELTADYFREVLAQMGERALCSVYYVKERPVAANLMLINGERLIDKFFCMRTEEGHNYNLYFLSWFSNLELCLKRGLRIYQSGQAGYETKLRLGSRLIDNSIYFRHRNRFVQMLLRMISPLLAFTLPIEKKA